MKRFARAFIPIVLTLTLLLSHSAYADAVVLVKEELFSAIDTEQSVDLCEARVMIVSDDQNIVIESAGSWILRGSASNVTILVDAGKDAEVRLFLDGLNIHNRDLPCVYVGEAGKTIITLSSDSVLSVRENFRKESAEKANGVIYSRADLTLNGDGTLTISSPKNGIVCKDRLRITGGNYVISAGSKAIAADNAIWISDGSFRLTAESDGLHAENEDDDREGSVFIGGGCFEIDAGDDGIHGQSILQIEDGALSVHADEGLEGAWILINGGTLDILSSGDGINAARKSEAYRPKVEINGGRISIVMDGQDTDAIDSNADLVISGGTITISGSGIDYDGELVFSGGTVILDGNEVQTIPNQSTHHLGSAIE